MPSQKACVTGTEFPPLEPGTLRLYSNRFCPYAQRARIVLAHKDIPYETVNSHLRQKPEWILKLNPLGTVPVLQKDDVVLYESLIVCEYLDEVYPGEKVVPSDPYQKAKDQMFVERFSKVVSKYYAVLRGMKEGAIAENAAEMMSALNIVEEELKQRNTKFLGGDKPMLIDFAMWPHLERMLAMGKVIPALAINSDAMPLFAAWCENLQTVPAIQATVTSAENHLAFFNTIKQGNANYDLGLEE